MIGYAVIEKYKNNPEIDYPECPKMSVPAIDI